MKAISGKEGKLCYAAFSEDLNISHLSMIGSRMIGSRSWVIDWSRLVVDRSRLISRCWVVWGRLVNRCWWVVRSRSRVVRSRGRSVFSLTIICNISDVSTITINTVSYSLDSSIGKSNIVTSRSRVSVTFFIGTKVNSGIVISNSISVVVGSWDISISGGRVVRGRGWGIDRGRLVRSRWA